MNNLFYRGDDDKNEKKLSEDGSIMSESYGLFFLCIDFATCTKKVSRRVSKILNISNDAVQISTSPDKQNIKLVVVKNIQYAGYCNVMNI